MSKWSLLRSALHGRRDADNPSSIHAYPGLIGQLLGAQRTLWAGFEFDHEVEQGEAWEEAGRRLLRAAEEYMVEVDCAECFVNVLIGVGDTSEAGGEQFLREMLEPLTAKEGTADASRGQCIRIRFLSGSEGAGTGTAAALRPGFVAVARVAASHPSLVPMLARADYLTYRIPQPVLTRERPRGMGVDSAGLLSNLLHDGIDNTGNVCVWDAEQILLLHLSELTGRQELVLDGLRVLELGGGMTGLCGLGLARINPKIAAVVVTDGHPLCVRNQTVCIKMNKSLDLRASRSVDSCLPMAPIKSRLLRWSAGDKYGDLAGILSEHSGGDFLPFDVIVAADCLFFRDFHKDLLWLLRTALAPTGVIYLLQPRRADSMDIFLKMAAPFFAISATTDFSPEITRRAAAASQDPASGFNSDVHLPTLLTLRQLV